MEAEEKKLTAEEKDRLLSEGELEETAGGHIVIRGGNWKAYKLYCPKCGSAHLQFVWKTYDVNRHPGEGNYDISMGDMNMMMFGNRGRPVRCLDCNAQFRTNEARWSDNVEWNPNDYSD